MLLLDLNNINKTTEHFYIDLRKGLKSSCTHELLMNYFSPEFMLTKKQSWSENLEQFPQNKLSIIEKGNGRVDIKDSTIFFFEKYNF